MRFALVPRAPGAVDAVNEYLAARGTQVDLDTFVVDVATLDVANRCVVTTGLPGEPIREVVVTLEAPAGFGAGLEAEARRLCEELAARFDLVLRE